MRLFFYYIVLIGAMLTACSDRLSELEQPEEAYPQPGSEVAFSALCASSAVTKADGTLPEGYEKLKERQLTVTMIDNVGNEVDKATYQLDEVGAFSVAAASTPLYWPDNVKPYGFMVQAGVETLNAVQTAENWSEQDLLTGYAAVPNEGTLPDAAEKKTSKGWYAANKAWLGESATSQQCRTIPLFLKHERVWVTVILKAGEGVRREDLNPETAATKISAFCYSYASGADNPVAITPRQGSEKVNYEAQGSYPAENDRPTVRYDAIIEPHDFTAKPNDDKLLAVSVANQNFSFYASNDKIYTENNTDWKSLYNLTAGKHLTLTATLSRDSRKILISAFIEDWEEEVNAFVCDDFGGNGSPEVIKDRESLLAFLKGDKNKAGNVGIIAVSSLDLTTDWNPTGLTLHSTLNLGGSTLKLSSASLLEGISSTGSLVGGTLSVSGKVTAAVCQTNQGTIDRVHVIPETSTASATRAGVVVSNHGLIISCSSALDVTGQNSSDGSPTYIGGIAAESWSEGNEKAYIQDCVMTGCVDVAENATTVYGGGIVGKASGVVQNNSYEFGVTLQQVEKTFSSENLLRNIIHTQNTESDALLTATNNRWPTNTSNTVAGENIYPDPYDQMIRNQEELAILVEANSNYNVAGKKYALSTDFEVDAGSWGFATKSDVLNNTQQYNLLCTLDGNDKTITLKTGSVSYDYTKSEQQHTGQITTVPMLFSNITGTILNLHIHLAGSLQSLPTGDATDVAAPLAYALAGGTLKNITVTAERGVTVQGAAASGLVVWAYDNPNVTEGNREARMIQCRSKVSVVWKATSQEYTDGSRYAGGLVSQAAQLVMDRCGFSGTITGNYQGTLQGDQKVILGGLVGGVGLKRLDGQSATESDSPKLLLTDCYSRWQPGDELSGYIHGSILGSAYTVISNKDTHGVDSEACQGNWWVETTKPVGQWLTAQYPTAEKVIGKRNSVEPADE